MKQALKHMVDLKCLEHRKLLCSCCREEGFSVLTRIVTPKTIVQRGVLSAHIFSARVVVRRQLLLRRLMVLNGSNVPNVDTSLRARLPQGR